MSRHGVSEFTFTRSHSILQKTQKKSICLVVGVHEGDDLLHLAVIYSKSPISTLDTRVKICSVSEIYPPTYSELVAKSSQNRRTISQLSNESSVIRLTQGVSTDVARLLASYPSNEEAIINALSEIDGFGRQGENNFLQSDAIKTALKIFDLPIDAKARIIELAQDKDTALQQIKIIEDGVIEHDARSIPGLQLESSDVTGRAVFSSRSERLEVITANKRPLEEVFGVDLIYFNQVKRSVVMVQYKMLDREGKTTPKWVYRPDAQLEAEIKRMHQFALDNPVAPNSYRLNSGVFYLKFIKRDLKEGTRGIVLPLEHFEQYRSLPKAKGRNGGIRVEYEALEGQYLRQTAFIELVRSGYVGTYPESSENLMAFIEFVLQSGKSVVTAIQTRNKVSE